MTTRTGPFEVGLDAFLSEKYLEETRINLLYLKHLDHTTVIELGFAKVLLPNVTQISPDEIFKDGRTYIDSLPDKTADYAINSIENFFIAEDRYVEVVTHSLPLRGRYRWSVIYIEHLAARYLRQRASNKAPNRPPHLDGLLGRTSPRLVRL